jgi:hypothetical protein
MTSHLATLTFSSNKVVLDVSEWQTLTVQLVAGGGTRSLLGTNDDGAIHGSTSGSAKDAANFTAVQAVRLSDGTAVTAITDGALYRIDPISFKYLQIGDGASAAATKILVFKTKPY